MSNKEILFLEPCFSHTIWGGTKLRDVFGYKEEGNDIGECWGISAHEQGDCKIKNDFLSGKTLSQIWEENPELFGNYKSDRFPLLTKIIDAKDDLSIQVHPDDEYAMENENGSLGKTECWYVLECDENATLVVGHNAKSKEELSDMILNAKWNSFIREVPIKKGDFIQIDPGTVHAIKGGTVILETQQNSAITYRVYDYDRLSNGLPRELHINQSIDVITVPAKDTSEAVVNYNSVEKNTLVELISCKYYDVFKIEVDQTFKFEYDCPFMLMSVADGSGKINGHEIKKGDHFIIPNKFGEIIIEGKMDIIASTVK